MSFIIGRMRRVDDEQAVRRHQAEAGIEAMRYTSGAYPALAYCEEGERPVKLPEKSDLLKARLALRAFFVRSEAYPRLRLRG